MNFNKIIKLISIALLPLILFGSHPQNKDNSYRSQSLTKTTAIDDRAGGLHNVSNIGLFFENRGKLYPRRLTDGPSGEFPINSGRHYIYRSNPMVGISADPSKNQKVNVIQGRFTQNEEWEAAAGYRNPALAKIAMSDNPNTWPQSGWPIKDKSGKNIILSDQDSYCVYNDSTNTVKIQNIEIAQTGYAFGVNFAEDMIFFKYDVINNSNQSFDSLYFALYCDIDIGNVSGGDPEYADDLFKFMPDKNFIYFYDADGYSAEWGGSTGMFGALVLATPDNRGVTDMHWNLYYDDIDDDSLQYAIMSSKDSYFPDNFDRDKYFHPGSSGDPHIDDINTLSSGGEDVLANLSSGPYQIHPGDTLSFYTAFVAGVDKKDLLTNMESAYNVYKKGFNLPKPPDTPSLSVIPGDEKVTLFWNDIAEHSLDKFSGEYDFEGYNIYRSIDKGITWDQIDRNRNPKIGPDPVPIASFDKVNNIGDNTGLQYSFIDSTVKNGFEYWYTITAYDRGDSLIESLESPLGRTLDAINTIIVIPRNEALGYQPVHCQNVSYIGSGQSNYIFDVTPFDNNNIATKLYEIGFTYTPNIDRGNPGTEMELLILDSLETKHYSYGFEFLGPDRFKIYNKTLDELIREYPYRTGVNYNLGDGLKISFSEQDSTRLPEAGDYLSMDFSIYSKRNDGELVLQPRPLNFNTTYATEDSIIFQIKEPQAIQNVSQPIDGNSKLQFTVIDESALLDTSYSFIIANSQDDFVSMAIFYNDNGSLGVIDTVDTLYNNGTFQFNGVEATFTYNTDSPPTEGTNFSLKTLVPIPPTILDKYQFELEASSTNYQEVSSQLEQIRVVPNPYIVSSLWEPEFGELRKEPLRHLQFINLPAECTIKVFTVAGDLIKTIKHTNNTGTETWDLRADGGREITAGIYVYVVQTNNEQYINRFGIIK